MDPLRELEGDGRARRDARVALVHEVEVARARAGSIGSNHAVAFIGWAPGALMSHASHETPE